MYSEKVAIAFLKDMEKSKVIKKGFSKNQEVIDCIWEVINMSADAIKNESQTAQNLYHEFTDWIETYQISVN